MASWPILSVTIFLPLVGSAFIMMVRGDEETVARNARAIALWTSLVTLIVSIGIWIGFDPRNAGFQMVDEARWMPSFGMTYRVGVDGISVFFVLLSTFLTPLCVIASWTSIKKLVREYMIAFLVMETMMVGMFCALDLILFYLFFEGVLVPMFLIIGVWGGPRRIYSAFKFFLYTFAGSVLMLIAILTIYFQTGTSDIATLVHHATLPVGMQKWLWIAFFASFAVKVPMWPLHTWLPDAHVEAPTAGSVILAAVLLKMGGYGFLRFSLPMLPDASHYFAPLIFVLSIVAIIYTSLVALAQEDMKKLIAYSSVAHMGFVTLGIFAFTEQAVQGAVFQMLSHGILSAALFLCVGVVYDRLHTREIARYGGLALRMPAYAAVFMVFMLGAVGLPGTSGFIGEFLVLIGTYQVDRLATVLATTGIILSVTYMLWLYRAILFGPLVKNDLKTMLDLNAREILVFTPLVLVVLWMGIYPALFLDGMAASVQALSHQMQATAGAHPSALAFLFGQ